MKLSDIGLLKSLKESLRSSSSVPGHEIIDFRGILLSLQMVFTYEFRWGVHQVCVPRNRFLFEIAKIGITICHAVVGLETFSQYYSYWI